MLHEILLALSGHPSPLFDEDGTNNASGRTSEFPLVSPSERALLRSIGRLSTLHRKAKAQLRIIISGHASIICRSVAASIQHIHLARFQQRILDVESKILSKDASLVGAYDIVPLASVIGEFDDWHRRMAWYWDLACFMLPVATKGDKPGSSSTCTGAAVIDKLRLDAQTGFPEIEEAAIELSRAAETAWLRQLTSWIVYGKLPNVGKSDFFIQMREQDETSFEKRKDLLPSFVSASTADAVFMTGRSIHQVLLYRRSDQLSPVSREIEFGDSALAEKHLACLSDLNLPFVPSQLSRAVAAIKLSLSQNLLQRLLPIEDMVRLLSCLRQFFLLDRGEFAVALITQAEDRVQTRQHSIGKLLLQDPVKAMQGLLIKDAELSQTLRQTWKALQIHGDDAADDDSVLAYAEKHISLHIPQTRSSSRPSTSTSDSLHGNSLLLNNLTTVKFNNLLFPNPTELDLKVPAPFDLFLSTHEIERYSLINAYLVSVRRAHLRLSDLWRRTAARRDPSGTKPSASISPPLSPTTARSRERKLSMRRVWATCSAATFLLSEVAAFLEGEVIRGSCNHFQAWIEAPNATTEAVSSTAPKTQTSPNDFAHECTRHQHRDPETLSAAHRTFLAALTDALLLTDIPYTSALRSLLGNIDNLIAFFIRHLEIQQKLTLEDEGVLFDPAIPAPSSNPSFMVGTTLEESQRIALEIDRARKKVDADLKAVIARLRRLDGEVRVGGGVSGGLVGARGGRSVHGSLGGAPDAPFTPWPAAGVELLLMKLEFGRMFSAVAPGGVGAGGDGV